MLICKEVGGRCCRDLTPLKQEIDSLDDVEKMAYKVNEILLMAKETIWPLRMRMNQTFLSSDI